MKTAITLLWLALSTALAFAEDYRCCLRWDVQVVDDRGQPLPQCTVVQEWGYNFGNIATNFTEQASTDKAGRVRLPERGVAYPISTVEKVIDRVTVRKGLGAWANIFVWKEGFEGQFVYSKNDARAVYTTNGIFSRVVLRPPQSAGGK